MLNKYAKLIYRAHNSSEYGISIQFPFNLIHPIPDLNAIHVTGRNGDFIQDEGSYQNVTETFNVLINRPLMYNSQFELEAAITAWLFKNQADGLSYDYLKFDYFPGYVLEATVKEPYSLIWKDELTATGTISFYCKPFWKRIDGIYYKPIPRINIANSILQTSLNNEENTIAIPDWHIVGNGDFSIVVNGFPYEFNDIESEVWLNGQEGNATTELNGDDTTLINNQIRLANNTTPKLFPGENTFELKIDDGSSVSKIEYKPNWGRLI